MIETILADERGPLWIDVATPTEAELEQLTKVYGIPEPALEECMTARHLPKHEVLPGGRTFVLTRVYDVESPPDAMSIPEITRKLSVFLGERFLITLHQRRLPFLEALEEEVQTREEPVFLQALLLEILLAGAETFHAPLEQAELRIHELETSVLDGGGGPIAWDRVFETKVRVQTMKRLLWHTQNTTQKYVPRADVNQPLVTELRERLHSLSFFAESMDDDLDNLLAVQLSLTANRTNDVMRLLALFSAVFLPITFIVGVYGMNFDHMPELAAPHGYAVVWLAIALTTGGVLLWFKRRGWTH